MPTRATETGTETKVRNLVYWASTVCAAIRRRRRRRSGSPAHPGRHGGSCASRLSPVLRDHSRHVGTSWCGGVLAPRRSRPKEWAYAGMVFALSGAALSHAASGDPYQRFSSRWCCSVPCSHRGHCDRPAERASRPSRRGRARHKRIPPRPRMDSRLNPCRFACRNCCKQLSSY